VWRPSWDRLLGSVPGQGGGPWVIGAHGGLTEEGDGSDTGSPSCERVCTALKTLSAGRRMHIHPVRRGLIAGRHSMTGIAGADQNSAIDQFGHAWCARQEQGCTAAECQRCSSVGVVRRDQQDLSQRGRNAQKVPLRREIWAAAAASARWPFHWPVQPNDCPGVSGAEGRAPVDGRVACQMTRGRQAGGRSAPHPQAGLRSCQTASDVETRSSLPALGEL
jgi:hypothetical protein